MEQFLIGRALQEAIRDVLDSANVRCMVAFWGQGAEQWFGTNIRKARIICNLKMGGTNPEPIRLLRADAKRFDLRQCDVLHAKVYIGNKSAVVTSANMSANGLGFEGAVTKGWIEAGVRVTENDELNNWFDDIWNDQSLVRQITDEDLKKAEKLRNSLMGRQRLTYVVIYSEDLSPAGETALKNAEDELGKKLGGYEDWDEIPAAADLLEFQVGSRFVKYNGCWQTFDPELVRPTKARGKIKLAQRKRVDSFGKELKKAANWKSIVRKIS